MTDDIVARLDSSHAFFGDPLYIEARDEIERLLLIEQGAANPCDKCGWRMKFPNEECRNCENAKLRDEIERLWAALREVAEVYAGSEGIPQPMTAAEGYLLQLLMEMFGIACAALEGEKAND